jgi:hypothetical protein
MFKHGGMRKITCCEECTVPVSAERVVTLRIYCVIDPR